MNIQDNVRKFLSHDTVRGWVMAVLFVAFMVGFGWLSLADLHSKTYMIIEFAATILVLAALIAVGSRQADKAPTGQIRRWVTTADKKCQEVEPLSWRRGWSDKNPTIRILPDITFQTILGWGAHFTDSACWVISQMAEKAREALLFELIDPSMMDLNVLGFTIGSSDYSPKDYNPADGLEPDPELKRFSIEYDKGYKIPVLRRVLQINPNVLYVARPWSPSPWMKPSKTLRGGNMNYVYMDAWGDFFVKFIQSYDAEGVPIYAVTSQNEPDTDQNGSMTQSQLSIQQERDFVGGYMYPRFQKNGIKTLIWIHDHNFDSAGRPLSMSESADFLKCVGGYAWHPYGGDPIWMARFRKMYPHIDHHITEGTAVFGAPDYLTDHTNWSGQLTTYSRCEVNSVSWWNIALTPDGKPNVGPFGCGGMVSVDLKTNEVVRSGQYWGTAHFSRFVKRGAKRIESKGEIKDLQHVAFINPDGTGVMVVTNNGDERTVSLQLGAGVVDVLVEKGSTTTLTWKQ